MIGRKLVYQTKMHPNQNPVIRINTAWLPSILAQSKNARIAATSLSDSVTRNIAKAANAISMQELLGMGLRHPVERAK